MTGYPVVCLSTRICLYKMTFGLAVVMNPGLWRGKGGRNRKKQKSKAETFREVMKKQKSRQVRDMNDKYALRLRLASSSSSKKVNLDVVYTHISLYFSLFSPACVLGLVAEYRLFAFCHRFGRGSHWKPRWIRPRFLTSQSSLEMMLNKWEYSSCFNLCFTSDDKLNKTVLWVYWKMGGRGMWF